MNMKTLKLFGILLMFAVVGTGFISCSEDYESRLPELLLKNVSFSTSESGSEEILLRNEDLTFYDIKSDQDWCYPSIDVKNSKIIIRVYANETYDDRTATITLSDIKDGKTTRTFTVSQAQMDWVELKGVNTFEAEMKGGTIEVPLRTNIGERYTVEIPSVASSWISVVSKTRGLEDRTLTLNVAKNNSGNVRDAIISVVYNDISVPVKIRQKFDPVFSLDVNSISIDENGGTFDIQVNANITFDVYPEDDWVQKAGNEDLGEDQFVQTLKVLKFDEKKEERKCNVLFESAEKFGNTELRQYLTVTQYRHLFINEEEISVTVGDSLDLDEHLFNKDKLVLTWKSSDNDVVTVDAQGRIKAIAEGEANVTVTSKDGKHTDYVQIIVEKPKDLTNFLTCEWDTGKDITGKDTIYTVGCTISMDADGPGIVLKGYTFYNDSVAQKTVEWDGKYLGPNSSVSSADVQLKKQKNYYIDWKYTYAMGEYTLRYSMDKKVTIIKKEKPAATRRNTARSRRR